MDGLEQEVKFKTFRSGGKGGQNVNKVETAVEAHWSPRASKFITAEERDKILERLAHKINSEGFLTVRASASRFQLKNKETAIQKMQALLKRALAERKPRKPTKPSAAAKRERMKDKQIASVKKQSRKKPGPEA